MNTAINAAGPSPDPMQSMPPVEALSWLEQNSVRFETPCGNGMMIWRCWGAGRPILLLHGGHGAWSHWVRNIPHLSQSYTCWVPDLPACGDSASPPDDKCGDGFAAVIATEIRTLIAYGAPIDVVGFSFGGVLAAHIAAIAPDLIRRLILVDTGGLGTPKGDFSTKSLRADALQGGVERVHRHNLLQIMLHRAASVDALALYIQSMNVPRGRVIPDPLVMPDKLKIALSRSIAPLAAIWGEFDRPHPDPHAQREALLHFQPDIDFKVIQGAGHWCMFEEPLAFNAALDALLQKPPAPERARLEC